MAGMNTHAVEVAVEKVVDWKALTVLARLVSVALAPAALILFIRLLDTIADLDDTLHAVATMQSVQEQRIDRIEMDIERMNTRFSNWSQIIYTQAQAERTDGAQDHRLDRLEQFMYQQR